VKPGQEADFESTFAEAKSIIASMPGFEGLSLSRCIERPGTYLLLVQWARLEDHTAGFEARSGTKSGVACCTTSTSRSPRWSTTHRFTKPDTGKIVP